VTLSVLRHAEPRQVPLHSHAHMFLAVLLEGGYREWLADGEIEYRPLSVVFHPENLEHRDEISRRDTTFFTVEVSPDLLGPRDRRARGLASVRDLSGGAVVWEMLRLLAIVRGHHHDAVECEEPVAQILDELLGRSDAPRPAPRWLGRVEAHLHAGFREPVALGALAELTGVHPVHVARVFRRHHGCTIHAFVRRQRVLYASRMIAAGRATLAATAIDSGFCDQSHLNHAFKAVTGMTPLQYRRLMRTSA